MTLSCRITGKHTTTYYLTDTGAPMPDVTEECTRCGHVARVWAATPVTPSKG